MKLERIEKCLKIAAQLVVLHGDEFLWAFERMEKERDAAAADLSAAQRAKDVVNGIKAREAAK